MLLLFLRDLKYHWFEYLLSSAVIAVAVATLVVQHSVTSSAESSIHELAHGLGKNMLVVPEDTNLSEFYRRSYGPATMMESYPEKIRSSHLSPHIGRIQARLYGNTEVSDVPLIIVGEGNSQHGSVGYSALMDAIVGEPVASQLSLRQGDLFSVGGVQLKTSEVKRSLPDNIGMGIFTSMVVAQEVLNHPGKINAMRLGGCWCKLDVPKLALDVEKVLPGTRAITVAGVMKAQTETIDVMKRYSIVIYAVMSLFIAAIVVILMLSQVRRQMREVGLLLATGTPPWVTIFLFITKAALVSLTGGVLGYLLGSPLTEYFASRFIGLPLSTSPVLLLPVTTICVLIGIVSALLPVLWATKQDPTEVLRGY